MPGVHSQVRVVSVRVQKPTLRLRCFLTLLFSIAIGCIISLCICGAFIVNPYLKIHFFEETTCTTTNVKWEEKYAKCCVEAGNLETCEEPGFPCLVITASVEEDGGKSHSAIVYKDDKTWGMETDCSYPLCDAYQYTGSEPNIEASAFADKYKEGSSYSCFYNPNTGGEVIINKSVSRMMVFHSMFWSSLVLVLSVVGICLLVGRPENESRKMPGFTRL